MSEAFKEKESPLEFILNNCFKIPVVKVNRKEFLISTFEEYCKKTGEDIYNIIEVGPVKAGVDRTYINKIATSLIEKRAVHSSGASFVVGLPGGVAMAASIPADTMQFFAVALRLSQELAYIYGYSDMWKDGELDSEKVKNELILFLGVMFGVSGAAATLKVIADNIAKEMLKKLPHKALDKVVYCQIVKKIATIIGVKITKQSFAKGVSKVVPVLGGVVSGGMTYFSMKPMGKRLRDTLNETIDYTENDFKKDMENLEKVIDVDFTEVNSNEDEFIEEIATDTVAQNSASIADEILKLKTLLDMGAISQEEFDECKKKLMASL